MMRDTTTQWCTSAAVTFAAAPLVRKAMLAAGTMDVPNHRSSHTMPIPRGGGLAALVGIGAAVLVGGPRGLDAQIVVPVLALAATGYSDDRASANGGLPAMARLGIQVGAGLCIGDSSALGRLTAVLTVPGVVNVVNFMDGINGITALTCITWGLHAAVSARPDVQLLGAVTAGSAAGFLPWNAPEAQMFLGDVGSYLYGATMAAGIILSFRGQHRFLEATKVGAALLPYAADAAQAIYRRRTAGASLTEAHREHTYQQLVDLGALNHSATAVLHAAVATICAQAWRRTPPLAAAAISVGAVGAYLAAPRLARRIRSKR